MKIIGMRLTMMDAVMEACCGDSFGGRIMFTSDDIEVFTQSSIRITDRGRRIKSPESPSPLITAASSGRRKTLTSSLQR